MSVGKQGDINVPFEINTFLSQVIVSCSVNIFHFIHSIYSSVSILTFNVNIVISYQK